MIMKNPSVAFRLWLAALTLIATLAVDAHAQDRVRPWPVLILPPRPEASKPMQLKEMEVRAHMVGLHVEATTTLTFFNPNQRQLEGELVFPLPDGAVVTGYALDVNGTMRNGVVVKKEKARVAFETEVRRGVDPGIVEQVAGNLYRTRIYPLPPEGVRRIRLRYVAELPANEKGEAAWHLPLPVGETIGKLSIRVEVAKGLVTPEIGGFGNLHFGTMYNSWVAETHLDNAKPGDELWVALPKLPAQLAAVERTLNGDHFFAISDLPGPSGKPGDGKAPKKLGIAWDASGSRSQDTLQKEVQLLQELFKKWPKQEVTLIVFRDHPEDARAFHGDTDALIRTVADAFRDGGTDLSALATKVRGESEVDRWLLFTDGFDTIGERMPDFAKRRVTAVVSQSIAHRELLRQVCADSGGQLVDLQQLDPVAAAEAIVNPPPTLVAITGSGVTEVQGIGAVAHGRVSVHGVLYADETELTLEYSDGRRSAPVKLAKKPVTAVGSLLACVWAANRVHRLSVRPEDNESELLELGRLFGIVSPATSLIVLENVDQYVRHDIQPPASEPELLTQWRERKAAIAKQGEQQRSAKIDRVLAMWKERVNWWEKKFDVSPEFKWKSEDKTDVSPTVGGAVMSSARSREVHRSFSSSFSGGAAGAVAHAPAAPAPGELSKQKACEQSGATATIAIKPWDPATPYLAAIKAAAKENRYRTYLRHRQLRSTSPSFFVDCGEYFLAQGETVLGIRILTNLAEMKLDDAPLLRVLAWRLEQAGQVDRAIMLLRKVAKLRPEEPQSCRDLALALAERGKPHRSPADLGEAMSLLERTVMTEWARFPEIEVIALEELNALITWVKSRGWVEMPKIPKLDERLQKNLDVDVRIVMSWDADNTDVDLHVLEPSGQEAFYGANRTAIGGLVSRDFTQGYGPEEYLVHRAQPGIYKIFAHYYGSQQQTVTGPATITATVFTNFGRPAQTKQVLSLRLDKPKDKQPIGEIQIGDVKQPIPPRDDKKVSSKAIDRSTFRALTVGQSAEEVKRLLGEPVEKEGDVWIYRVEAREYRHEYRVKITAEKGLISAKEIFPGNAALILVQ